MSSTAELSKYTPAEIEVYNVQLSEGATSQSREGIVLRWLNEDGSSSFQCVTCHTESVVFLSPCAHVEQLKRQLGEGWL
jgi:hypothetical protein